MTQKKQYINFDFTNLDEPKVDVDLSCGVQDKLIIIDCLMQSTTQILDSSIKQLSFIKGSVSKTIRDNDIDEAEIINQFMEKLL